MVFHLDNTLGAAFIGVVVAAGLHGVSCVQAWWYYTHQNDRWPLKLLVAAVMVFDTVHQGLISHTLYTYLVTNYDNPIELSQIVWSLLVEVLFNGLTALLVQSFLTVRIWRLSNRNSWLTGAALILVLGEFVIVTSRFALYSTWWAPAYVALSLQLQTFAELTELKSLSITVNSLAAAGDVLIAATLCKLLHSSRTGFHRSDTMIRKLMMWAVNTGLITSICAIASLISITVAGNTFIYILFFFCMGRLYCNSLLATLNARNSIRGAADGVHTTSENLSLSLREFQPKNTTLSISSKRPNISIKIDTTQEFNRDADDVLSEAEEKFWI
ncbi:hypothetical protein MIND_00326100 [Mycena indigotica]|uniref:DUF6534 domain-containing protein n=1 Tax=Mycena indigotica TaxID=2126181 RepID=A0A8H6T437_9AGAR|nr:uncharacterized protein MIND_00326100 [Mycena indigotica]KAF7309552.1 hypothetical protein MIND_00326100 [Mycena indigotica]